MGVVNKPLRDRLKASLVLIIGLLVAGFAIAGLIYLLK